MTRKPIKVHCLLRYMIGIILARLACSDATCEMSRQPTLAKFGFRKSIEDRGSQRDINLPDSVAKTQKKSSHAVHANKNKNVLNRLSA